MIDKILLQSTQLCKITNFTYSLRKIALPLQLPVLKSKAKENVPFILISLTNVPHS